MLCSRSYTQRFRSRTAKGSCSAGTTARRRATTPTKGAVYVTCLGRGPHMLGAQSAELAAIQDELGEAPLVGLFCNGEISHNRVYGDTGVRPLFL